MRTKGWQCPKCRGACNCSVCRKKQGLVATGILATLSKKSGFASVSELLSKDADTAEAVAEANQAKRLLKRQLEADAAGGPSPSPAKAARSTPTAAKAEGPAEGAGIRRRA